MFNLLNLFLGLFTGSFVTWYLIEQNLFSWSRLYQRLYGILERSHLRSIKNQYNIDLLPFLTSIRSDSLFKYIQYLGFFEVNRDTAELHFEIQGLSERFKDDLETVVAIMQAKFRDFFIIRVCPASRPDLLVTFIDPETSLLIISIGKNAYGNHLLNQWREEREAQKRPNDDVLIED